MTDVSEAKERLMQDFNQVVTDTEQLLKSLSSAGGEKAQALRAKIEANVGSARERLREIEEIALERGGAAAKATDAYVRENPWQSMAAVAGIAAILGLVVGLIVNRR